MVQSEDLAGEATASLTLADVGVCVGDASGDVLLESCG